MLLLHLAVSPGLLCCLGAVVRAQAVLEELPARRAARDRLREALRRATLEDAIVALESDPGLGLRALRVANAQRRAGEVASVTEAAKALGLSELRRLADSVPVDEALSSAPASRERERFRIHAVAVHAAMAGLAELIAIPEAEEYVTAALLHDLGQQGFAALDGRYGTWGFGERASLDARLAAERARFGCDHAEFGARLGRQLGLPERLCARIGEHHNADLDSPAAVLLLADKLAHYAHGDVSVDFARAARLGASLGISQRALGDLLYELVPHVRLQAADAAHSPLSERELQVLRRIREGASGKELALELGLSESTIRSHLRRIYARLGVADRAQAVLAAAERGWL